MTPTPAPGDDGGREELVVVAPGAMPGAGSGTLVDDVRRRYGNRPVVICDTYMSAIARVGRQPPAAVLACVGSAGARVDCALAGLREAAGPDARIVLCCRPEHEPLVRALLKHGADDYLVLPLDGGELDAALGQPRRALWQGGRLSAAPSASFEELQLLAELLANLESKPIAVLEILAKLLRTALDAEGVTVVVSGSVASAGSAVARPVLTVPLKDDVGLMGQVLVGPSPRGPYAPAATLKLHHYAAMAGHVLRAAMRQRHWRELAETDELSGLPNRRRFLVEFADILARARRERFPVTLLLFDIDDFKTYNDHYGHDAGDEIIRTTAELFRRCCREHDLVARYGGDEFVVVFWDVDGPRVPGSRHPSRVLDIITRFTDALRKHEFRRLGAKNRGQLTISGGLASFPWDADAADGLITRADQALLEAKRAGKDRIVLIGQDGASRSSAAG